MEDERTEQRTARIRVYAWASTLIFVVAVFIPFSAQALSGPVILGPKADATIFEDRPLIFGLAPSGSLVRIYNDGKLIGVPQATTHPNGTGSFKFRPRLPFSDGTHVLTAFAQRNGESSAVVGPLTIKVVTKLPRNLDGLTVAVQNARAIPVGVMIENHPAARPQAGIRDASVVYETLAEGGITRLLAIYSKGTLAPKIGPVRSARPYYLSWAVEYGAPVMHAGGNPDAIHDFGALKLRSIDQLVGRTSRYFMREGSDVHSVVTTNARMDTARNDFKLDARTATFRQWQFKNDPTLAERPAKGKGTSIDFGSSRSYFVDWKYDRTRNTYLRWNGGVPHREKVTKGQIAAKNVIIQHVPRERVLDRKGRLSLEVRGRGKGWLLRDGQAIPITWNKKDRLGRTIYYTLDGKEVEFNRGPIWIEVLPDGKNRSVRFR